MKRTLLAVLFLSVGSFLFCQGSDLRGLKVVINQLEGPTAAVGKQYAVLIAIDKYENWMALRNPVKDAQEIKDILARRYYITDFTELYDLDATKAGIIKLFNNLISVTRPEDSVLIFYAGHGYLDKGSNTGFWIPVDGGMDLYQQANWLPNSQIRGFISNLKARHVALLADSCFSGEILNPTRGIAPTITEEYFKNAYARVCRQVLTSGASESVPDESPFTRQLKLALEGNTAAYLDPLMLYSQIRLGVKGTTPLFGDLKDSGHQEGASFILFLRQPTGTESVDESPGMKITVETKKYGTIRVETEEGGTLWIDDIYRADIKTGTSLLVENIEVGTHRVELRYFLGDRQVKKIEVSADQPETVDFTANSERRLYSVPLLDVAIDGKFDDWTVPPAFEDPSGDSAGFEGRMDIVRVFLARDLKNIYCRFDIADETKPSFFRPHNFLINHWSVFGIFTKVPPLGWLQLTVFYDPPRLRWSANVEVHKTEWDVSKWETLAEGSVAMSGSSLEASFPLRTLAPYIQKGVPYQTNAVFGSQSQQGTWSQPDRTADLYATFY